MALERYREMRDFHRTPEPSGVSSAAVGKTQFVIQKHGASREHFDFRLQLGGALKSWAVPKGPSLDPREKRLAVEVEDHPLDYADFEGVIPEGAYGAGPVIVWDRGTWRCEGDAERALAKGKLKLTLDGERLKGGWTLVRTKGGHGRQIHWLLIKERDADAVAGGEPTREHHVSVLSGRSLAQLAAGRAPAASAVDAAALRGAVAAPAPDPPRPQLASRRDVPPSGDGWVHEIKFDGYRTLACIAAGDARFFTRNGLDWTERYGGLAQAFAAAACRDAVVDGEIVVLDDEGRSSFARLQDTLKRKARERLIFQAFDLLHLDGHDVTQVPLLQRKRALAAVLDPVVEADGPVQLSDHLVGRGARFFAEVCEMGLEGIVAKRADAPYRPGRNDAWLKIKCDNTDDFAVVGYTEGKAGGLGALLLAEAAEDGRLAYVGKVGTGFGHEEGDELRRRLAKQARETPPPGLDPAPRERGAVWVTPTVTVEVAYSTRTTAGRVRQASFRRLREDKPPPTPPRADARRQKRPGSAAARPPQLVTPEDLAKVHLTNPERDYFATATKLDLSLYYARVGDWMLPHVLDRPLSVIRCPDGTEESCFYQRHARAEMADSVKRIALPPGRAKATEAREYLYVSRPAGFFELCQFSGVEFHPWGCRRDRPERPDRMVLDLDPDESLRWADVVEAAEEVRELLNDLGLPSFLKTTGGKGLHLTVPLARRHGWERLRLFAAAIAGQLATAEPKRFTAVATKKRRGGRIFIDHLRNGRGATAVAPYSARARRGLPVATPIAWNELYEIDGPQVFTIANVPARLQALGADPWAGLADHAATLTQGMADRLGVGRDWREAAGAEAKGGS